MKNIYLAIGCLLSSLLPAGCNDWLNVRPQNEIPKEQLFETQRGFRSALTGAYIRMKAERAYGGALLWDDVEYMAGNWHNLSTTSTVIPALIACNYENAGVIARMDGIYQRLYEAIADVNSILEVIDGKQSIFTDGNYEMIKGEALAIRAFCHFDVLRLFGPIPANPGEGELLPYVKAVNNQVHPHLTYQAYVQNILDDLEAAAALLKEVDPILTTSLAELSNTESALLMEDNYWGYRQVRMNYYAALAAQARVYMWLAAGDPAQKENAARYAQMVIDAKDGNGVPTFRLGEESDRALQDYTFSCEHILALHLYDLDIKAEDLFGRESTVFARYEYDMGGSFFYLGNLFPAAERAADVRYAGMWEWQASPVNGWGNLVYNKYLQNSSNPKLQVPLLRLSEMYLILTECAATQTEAETAYKAFCDKKGIPFTAFAGDWEADRRNKLIREYVREFYAEGQTFFTYKRFNITTFLPSSWASANNAFPFNGKPEKYIVPKPLREIEYHNN